MNLGKIQIGCAFRALEGRVALISIAVEIINPYFYKYQIKNSWSLEWFLITMIHQLYGLTSRCWFDRSRQYNTISVVSMYHQIKSTKKYNEWPKSKCKEFDSIGGRIKITQKEYEKKLRTLAEKYIFHTEYRTPTQIRKEKEQLKIGWKNIEDLIKQARELTNYMYHLWSGKNLSFESGHYARFSNEFWEAIASQRLGPRQHFTKK